MKCEFKRKKRPKKRKIVIEVRQLDIIIVTHANCVVSSVSRDWNTVERLYTCDTAVECYFWMLVRISAE